jgi:hypothetical protein
MAEPVLVGKFFAENVLRVNTVLMSDVTNVIDKVEDHKSIKRTI